MNQTIDTKVQLLQLLFDLLAAWCSG